MNTNEKANAKESGGASVIKCASTEEKAMASGIYLIRHFVPKEGKRDECHNLLLKIDHLLKNGAVDTDIEVVSLQKKYDTLVELTGEDTIENVVCTLGKNIMLDAALAGSTYTVTGPYMGLISSVSYTSVPVAGDTMSSHATWYEAGYSTYYPLYTAPRKTCAWSSASGGSKALSAALNFPIVTTGGTVKGCFIVYGTGAVSTINDTNGTLYSAGLFTGGDKVVGVGDTLQVSYSTSL